MADSWRLRIPAPTTWVSSNDRRHWAAKARLVREWRRAGALYAKSARLPHLDAPVSITAWVHRTDRRRADAANRYPTVKAVVDGLVDAGVLDDDSDRYVTAVVMKAGPVVLARDHPLGLLTLEISIDRGSDGDPMGRDEGGSQKRSAAPLEADHADAR